MRRLGNWLGRAKVGALPVPKEGPFNGRAVSKDKRDNQQWMALLQLEEPPEDGRYISCKQIQELPAPAWAKKIRKDLPVIALWQAVKLAMLHNKNGMPLGTADRAVVPDLATLKNWNEISPKVENELLGVQQIKRGGKLAIVGGGISGLTLAWILRRARPDINIEIFEASGRLGGWIDSECKGNTIFESGPRTLLPSRAGTGIILRILRELGLADDLIGVPTSSRVNTKGLVYNGELVQLPNSLSEAVSFLAFSPLMQGLKWPILKEVFTRPRDGSIHDESVRSFVSRRFSSEFDSRLVSAVMRGIYGGSSGELSARAVARFSQLYYLERAHSMSVLNALFTGSLGFLDAYSKKAYPLLFDALVASNQRPENPAPPHCSGYSLFTLKNGLQTLCDAMGAELAKSKNFKVHLNTAVTKLQPAKTGVTLQTASGEQCADVVVSTVVKADLFSSSKIRGLIDRIKHATLAVVNVHVPEKIGKQWFGALVPTSEDAANKDGLLGIVFDSQVRAASRHVDSEEPLEVDGTNVTVMLGGDLWEEMSESEAAGRALRAVRKYVGQFDESRADVRVHIQRNCIPQMDVGFTKVSEQLQRTVAKEFGNRLAFSGMTLGAGVGVSDCVEDAVLLASRFCEQRKLLYPQFFFGEFFRKTRPDYFA